jgi:hypothetical protein
VALHLVGEILDFGVWHECIIRRDAGLPRIEQFGVGNALGSLVDVGGTVDDRGRLAAEFERDRGEIAPGGFRDQAADPGSSR